MVLGRFYLRQTSAGNLLGEFSNNTMYRISTESADIIDTSQRAFIGTYNSTWFEQGSRTLILEICVKDGTNDRILTLSWLSSNREPIFYGEGFIDDGVLIGNYWDSEIHDRIGNLL